MSRLVPPSYAVYTRATAPQPAMYAPVDTQMQSLAAMPSAEADEPRTPWYTWVLGGVVAVVLGVTGAWYITRDSSDAPAARATPARPAPIVAPAELPPIMPPALVELRFDSLPSGGVFADGHAAELCRTPCAFDVDLKDGGPTDKRVFVVHANGYQDKQVVVAVGTAGAEREFHVTLDQLATTPATAPPPTAPGRPQPKSRKPVKVSPSQPTPPAADPTPGDPKPSSSKIPDATDTLDPFRKP
jgi:hypothetical protein